MRSLSVVTLGLALGLSAAACGGSDGGSESSDITSGGTRITRADLPEDSELLVRATEIAEEWRDGNIMDGSVNIDAGLLKGSLDTANLQKYAKNVTLEASSDEEAAEFSAVNSYVVPASADFVEEVVLDIAHGFGYNTDEASNLKPIRKYAKELIGMVGELGELRAVSYDAILTLDGDSETERLVVTTAFVNPDTREFVLFYTRDAGL